MTGSHTGYEADLDRLLDVTDRMATVHADLHRLAEHVEARVRALHLTWRGEAATAHHAAQARWAEGFEEMRQALARMRQAARTAHDNYATAATANQRLWSQVE